MKPLVVSLYDKTGQMMKPWVDAGRMALLVDLQHPPGLTTEDGVVWRLGADLRPGFKMPDGLSAYSHVEFAAAFPPCDHLAVSGARWFKGKGLRALALSVDMFATAADACESFGCPYQIENPVSTISTYWRTPDHTFHPHYFSGHCADDNYTKKKPASGRAAGLSCLSGSRTCWPGRPTTASTRCRRGRSARTSAAPRLWATQLLSI